MAERGVIFKDDFVHTPNSSWFDMSYDFIFSHNIGELVPSVCMECLPEDVIHQKSTNFSRLAPLVAPTFGKLNMFSYHFYVRNRDIWTNWPSFYTEKNQRKSWQSEMQNPTFVPPVMPYLDVRKILYDSSLYIHKDLSGDHFLKTEATLAHDSCYDIHVFGLNKPDNDSIRYLVIYPHDESNSDAPAFSSAFTCKSLDLISISNGTPLIFPYIVNKNEENYLIKNQKHYYNPFSDGSLMDYLGVDLSGMLAEQVDWVLAWKANVGDFLLPFTIGTVVPAEPHVYYTSAELVDMDYQGIGFNDFDFFKNHVILGAIGVNYTVESGVLVSSRWYNASTDGKVYEADFADNDSEIFTDTVNPLYFDDESSKINSLPLRAYYFVYSEYFRDQNYIDINENVDFTRDGEDIDWDLNNDVIFDYLTLKIKAWEHDPYTSALPQSQKGDVVRFLNDARLTWSDLGPAGSSQHYKQLQLSDTTSTGFITSDTYGTTSSGKLVDLTVDLSAATVENLRFANARQRYLEKVARSGSREYEYLLAIWGADVADAKLNRPIYLSGDKSPVQISEVLQTSASQFDDSQPLGQMAGRGVSVGSDDYLEYVCPDSGFFIEICTAIPRVSYQQGLAGMFTRKLKLDYPLPDYAQLGEEQVPVSELWYSARDSEDTQPFGFQSRYYSFKYNRDRISGEFKSSLNHWTWSRIFKDRPYASKDFLEVNPDYRQFAVTDKSAEHIYSHMFHDIQVQRKLPVFGVPSL